MYKESRKMEIEFFTIIFCANISPLIFNIDKLNFQKA